MGMQGLAAPTKQYQDVTRVRLDLEEQAALQRLSEGSQMTASAVLRRLLRAEAGLSLPVAEVDRPVMTGIEKQLKAIGTNINQAVRAMNEGRVGYEPELDGNLKALMAIIFGLRGELNAMVKPERRPRKARP